MGDEYLRLDTHEEYAKRMDDEHKRQNHRIDLLEKAVEQNNKLLTSVERLAMSMENMQKELSEQGDRLDTLESRDGEMWRKVKWHIVTAVLTAFVTYCATQIGL
jgi:predicted  nucleic acid-binding Zn-ribbon protein